MRGYTVPSLLDLQRAYEFLRTETAGDKKISTKQFLVWVQWSRLDPRLAEIIVRWLATNFSQINPFKLWKYSMKSSCSQTLLVLTEFVKIRLRASNKKDQLDFFLVWSSVISKNINPTNGQLFFIPQGMPNPEKSVLTFSKSLTPFAKWGFAGSDNLANLKSADSCKTILSSDKRKIILQRLLRENITISVKDYISACGQAIHKRTAQRDLENFPNIKVTGFTRGRVYQLS